MNYYFSVAFGVYVHIPYCLQRCSYCDFATYVKSETLSPDLYVDLVAREIEQKAQSVLARTGPELSTIYFGGGTPSLLTPQQLVKVIKALEQNGFERSREVEITLEINPGTLNPRSVEELVENGFNRFSVGAQTFDDRLLKLSNRIHSSLETRKTLTLLREMNINFSADVLFALPHQTLEGLSSDLDELLLFRPNHISPYCLTVPEGHPMSKNRAPDEKQAEMFDLIERRLVQASYERYEISNFARDGFESRHNGLYWDDMPYWGLGLSSHSYLPSHEFGVRFWNPRSMERYCAHIETLTDHSWSPESHQADARELLNRHQALTDFCHTSLRRKKGLDLWQFEKKFKASLLQLASGAVEKNISAGSLEWDQDKRFLRLTQQGVLLSNRVFLDFTFLSEKPLSPERYLACSH